MCDSHVASRMSSTSDQFGHEARQLTSDEVKKLLSDTELVTHFRQEKLEKEAKKNWDLFYKRNQNRFFRDRNWTTREFQELIDLGVEDEDEPGKVKNLLEVGCGVGNFIWPLLKSGLQFHYYACDFSPVALDILKQHELYNPETCHVFQSDLSEPKGIASKLKDGTCFDFVSLIFVLSAIHPDKMKIAMENIYQVLRKGGVLIFRDYGLYDYAMLRFSTGHKLSDHFYVRQDGTRAYYFSIEFMRELATGCGFEVVSLEYIKRETVNLKEGLSVPRIFIQGKFCK